ncbi:hypothetical protein [Oceanidesulfovibrio marinus]|uniref:Uncharacterized protein n=1 Tax=Oceanidesulfovibrio marinus TaxID=370038 RepID=A0A6P1ZIN0_9BACT|nr:hypothetical protein [Oceanidesulfovibrio marinus]QJT08172.1 hypothetical protein E8L03_04200 [Oceanidesulfovibrio marinus]TVM35067.1 hypothetical protein DQK91_06615 [Oceanidesulfovibrio marinus]
MKTYLHMHMTGMRSLVLFLLLLFLAAGFFSSCAVTVDERKAMDARCRANPIPCLDSKIDRLKRDLVLDEKLIEDEEDMVEALALPDCDIPDCEEKLLKHTKRLQNYREVVEQRKRDLKDMEKKLEAMKHSQDGSNSGGSGGSSGGGHSW